jgi:hypothetical protein
MSHLRDLAAFKVVYLSAVKGLVLLGSAFYDLRSSKIVPLVGFFKACVFAAGSFFVNGLLDTVTS